MFDFHLHTKISFDTESEPRDLLAAAEARGLREICFTDHYDHHFYPDEEHDLFTLEDYARAYDGLHSDKVIIRRGVECGLTAWNQAQLDAFLSEREFDFVIGSVHYAKGYDPYFPEFWQKNNAEEAFGDYLLQVLECVKVHRNFDVLGHLNYVCKSAHNPTHKPLYYKDFRDLSDEIMRLLAQNGKGLEVNTSGMDRVGEFLPSKDFLKRFRELGGEIITVGSDAHDADRVGQYTTEAVEMVKDIFGYVCTFERRKPIFHK